MDKYTYVSIHEHFICFFFKDSSSIYIHSSIESFTVICFGRQYVGEEKKENLVRIPA